MAVSQSTEHSVDFNFPLGVEVPRFIKIEVASIFEGAEYLTNQGVFEVSGFFLTDSDYTLRNSLREFSSGNPDRVDIKVQKLLKQIKNTAGWDVAIITDQPDKGHQISEVVGFMKGYTPLLRFAELNDIEVLGGHNNLIKFVFDEQGRYKMHERSINETFEMLQRKGFMEREAIVWAGDTEEDVNFGTRLEQRLREVGYTGQFYMLKINRSAKQV